MQTTNSNLKALAFDRRQMTMLRPVYPSHHSKFNLVLSDSTRFYALLALRRRNSSLGHISSPSVTLATNQKTQQSIL